MRLRNLAGITLIAICISSNQAKSAIYPECAGMTVELQQTSDYIFSSTALSPNLGIKVTRKGNGNQCVFFVVLDNGTSGSAATRSLKLTGDITKSYPIGIFVNSGRTTYLMSKSEATNAANVITGTIPALSKSSAVIPFYPVLNLSTNQPSGTYSDTYNFTAYPGIITNFDPGSDPVAQKFTYGDGKFIDLSIVDSVNAAFTTGVTSQTLNFGNLSTNATKSAYLMLKYNAGYSISVKSDNSGKLKINPASTTGVNYTLAIKNQAAFTPTASFVQMGTQTTYGDTAFSPSGGSRLELKVTIGTVNSQPAGNYQDTISISVASTL